MGNQHAATAGVVAVVHPLVLLATELQGRLHGELPPGWYVAILLRELGFTVDNVVAQARALNLR